MNFNFRMESVKEIQRESIIMVNGKLIGSLKHFSKEKSFKEEVIQL